MGGMANESPALRFVLVEGEDLHPIAVDEGEGAAFGIETDRRELAGPFGRGVFFGVKQFPL